MISFSLKHSVYPPCDGELSISRNNAGCFLIFSFICLCITILFDLGGGGLVFFSDFCLRFTGKIFWQLELRQSLC